MRQISGDRKLSMGEKLLYMLLNFAKGIWGYRVFWPSTYWQGNKPLEVMASPGRKCIDDFLYQNLPKLLQRKEISVLNIGCGSGYIRKILHELGYQVNYTGLYIVKHSDFDKFAEYTKHSEFVQSSIENTSILQKYDFVVSVTALEHMKNDELALRKSLQMTKREGVQIHIVPTFWSLFLYFSHGYRQYTPARVKKLFEKANVETYRLGGMFSFFLHLFFYHNSSYSI